MGFLGCEDDARKYWGLQYSYMAFDELGDVDEPTWNAIHKIRAARLRSAAGVPVQFVGTGNPCGTAHKLCKDRYIDPAPPFTPIYDEESESYRIFIPGHMADNVALVMGDPKYAKRIRSMTGPKWYLDALINGDWSKNPEGNMFHREWFCKFFDLRQQPNFLFTVSSWDTAFKSTDDSAESAETIWGVTESDIYLLNAFADKLEFPELKAKAEMSYNAWSPNFVWVEDKASGPSLVQSLKKDTRMPVKAIKVDGDKQRRAFVVTPFFEAGKIWLPKSAPWVDKYVEQMCAFPAPGLCDLVDSTSQALTQIEKLRERWKKTQNKVVSLRGSIYGV
jgi:predicted phage terminase large subunit-like protein